MANPLFIPAEAAMQDEEGCPRASHGELNPVQQLAARAKRLQRLLFFVVVTAVNYPHRRQPG
jgi:hypothetical protein